LAIRYNQKIEIDLSGYVVQSMGVSLSLSPSYAGIKRLEQPLVINGTSYNYIDIDSGNDIDKLLYGNHRCRHEARITCAGDRHVTIYCGGPASTHRSWRSMIDGMPYCDKHNSWSYWLKNNVSLWLLCSLLGYILLKTGIEAKPHVPN